MKADWESVRKDIDLRPVEGVTGSNSDAEILINWQNLALLLNRLHTLGYWYTHA